MTSVGINLQTRIPALDLRAQYASIREEIREAIDRVLDAQVFILGPEVKALEREIAAYCGRKYAVGVASGTDALILSVHSLGIGPGDEVIVPSFTYIATADAVSLLGARPVFVDVDPDTFTLDIAQVAAKLTPRTRAVIPVHLYGQAADMDPLVELCRKHEVAIIEDCAQAIGATYHGRKVSSFGELGCLSFFPSKNLGGYGDGGMIVTDSDQLYSRLISLRAHGSTKKYYSEEQGWNSRLDEIQAAILRVKLRHLDHWIARRRERAQKYSSLLGGIPRVKTPVTASWGEHVFHQYTILVSDRDQIQRALADEGIASTVYYPVPIHLQPIYKELGHDQGQLAVSETVAQQCLSLPIYPELADAQIGRVVEAVRRATR